MYGQLQNFETAKSAAQAENIDAAVKSNKLAAIEIMQIYCYQLLVDSFGDVPYSEALRITEIRSPKYDDAKTIYVDL